MRFQCEHCLGLVAIDDDAFGQHVACGHCESIVLVPESRFGRNAVIDDYVIRAELGHGGMGVVYLAHQLSLDREVAVKVLMDQFTQNEDFVLDFVREARAAARINHRNVVQAYAVGQEDGIYYLAMECVKGMTLKEHMDEVGFISQKYALEIVRSVADALGFAWDLQKLIHRDIKPDNIMLGGDEAKLMDLGLARFENDTLASSEDEDEVMGTPQYISPEQLVGAEMDIRGDFYSLGATLFHAITGEFPFNGETAAEIAAKHLQAELVPPSQVKKGISKKLDKLVIKMMSKRPDDRHPDAKSLVAEIDEILDELNGKSSSTVSTGTGRNARMKSMNNTTRAGLRVRKSKSAKYANSYSGLSFMSLICFAISAVCYVLAVTLT